MITMTTIYVSKLYADDGKFGKEYKIQGTDGNYYQSYKPFTGVEEGATIEVETKPQTKPSKYFHIKSYKLLANPNSVSQTQPAGQGQALSPPPKPLPALTPELQVEFINKAFKVFANYRILISSHGPMTKHLDYGIQKAP